MSPYYFYKNASHLYVVQKPLAYTPTQGELINDMLGQMHIRTEKIKPLLVNCTVAPLANDCITWKNFTSSSSPSDTFKFLNEFLTNMVQQHQDIFIFSVLFTILLLLLLLLSVGLFLRIRRKRSVTPRNVDNSTIAYNTLNYTDRHSGHYEEISLIPEQNKKMIQPYDYDYLPIDHLQCASTV